MKGIFKNVFVVVTGVVCDQELLKSIFTWCISHMRSHERTLTHRSERITCRMVHKKHSYMLISLKAFSLAKLLSKM